ncbi:MAG: STAS domain-containing protein [Deltaproteobacteria bacterium]|jgi:rsbT antagonist protein RsbS|nr:STAS domain-containing protein [Deltaproteobacteria bacterium]
MTASSVQRIPLQVARGCVVASIQIDLDPEVLRQFRSDLLERVQESRANGVILDVSGIDILDLDDFNGLRRTMEMAKVMGARPVLSGLKPGVVSALIDLGVDPEGVTAVLNLDDAFRLLDEIREKSAEAEESIDDGHESNSDPGQG